MTVFTVSCLSRSLALIALALFVRNIHKYIPLFKYSNIRSILVSGGGGGGGGGLKGEIENKGKDMVQEEGSTVVGEVEEKKPTYMSKFNSVSL